MRMRGTVLFRRMAVWITMIAMLAVNLCPQAVFCVQAQEKQEAETVKTANSLNPDFDTALNKVYSYILSVDTNPDYGSAWKVIGLTRSGLGVSSSYTDTFYKNVYTYLEQNNWVITKSTYSSYSKLILALTAAGKDAQNIGGHNLLAYLSDFSNVKKQGHMGPLWALMALNCHPDYSIPVDNSASAQTTEEGLIDYLLDNQISSGGWSLSGKAAEPDPDVTGMTIQALSSYYEKRDDVTSAIKKAVDALALLQTESGGYQSDNAETAESAAQVITALSSIGIDGAEDSRFVNKNGNWPMSGLFQFYLSQGGFAHVARGDLNAMATEQGMYAMAAYKRMKERKTALYDMSDITLSPGEVIAVTPANSTEVSTNKTTAGVSASLTVAVSQIVLDYASVTVTKGRTKTLTAVVTPSSATNQKLKWSSSKKKVATVTQTGKVKALKAGTTVITAAATDGSGVSASCVVKVVASGTASQSSTATAGQTKSVSGSGASTKSLGTAASTKTLGGKSSGAEGSTDGAGGGWSFSGEEYVPEDYDSGDTWDTSFVDATEENSKGESWADKTITINIPLGRIFYTGMGGILVLVIEGIIWVIRKKRKERLISQ